MLMLIRILILNQRQGSPHRSFGAYEVSTSSKDTLRPCSIGINRFWLVELVAFFSCSIGKKPFSVGLVDQLFQPALSLVETVENDG